MFGRILRCDVSSLTANWAPVFGLTAWKYLLQYISMKDETSQILE